MNSWNKWLLYLVPNDLMHLTCSCCWMGALNPVLSGTSCLSIMGLNLQNFLGARNTFSASDNFPSSTIYSEKIHVTFPAQLLLWCTITAFYFLGRILLQNCQKMWFRNGIQKIPSPVTSCEMTFSVLNTDHLLSFMGPQYRICQLGQAEFLPLEVLVRTQTACSNIAVRDSLSS